jgi:hypothetical protein
MESDKLRGAFEATLVVCTVVLVVSHWCQFRLVTLQLGSPWALLRNYWNQYELIRWGVAAGQGWAESQHA